MRSLGFSLPDEPEGASPRLPVTVDNLSDSLLMRKFAEFTQWANYAEVHLARADIEEERLEALIKRNVALGLVHSWNDDSKRTVTEAKARRAVKPEFVKLEDDLLQARAVRKMLAALFSTLERDAAFLSRELSRRQGMQRHNDRTAKWGP